MGADDMHVVMYKVLAYLYDCMKRGEEPRKSRLAPGGDVAGPIPQSYWDEIMAQLADRVLVRGVSVIWEDNSPTVVLARPTVTLEGVEFLQDNSMMRRALKFLRETKSALPFV